MSRSCGTGVPLDFRCSRCRRRASRAYPRKVFGGFAIDVVLTGRKRRRRKRTGSKRSTDVAREYRCLTCGHVGWSTHADLLRKERVEGGEDGNE